MIDVEALKRWLLLSGLLFTAVGWWRAEVHNAQLAESAVGFRDLAQTCVDTSLTRLDGIESKPSLSIRCAWAALGPWRRT